MPPRSARSRHPPVSPCRRCSGAGRRSKRSSSTSSAARACIHSVAARSAARRTPTRRSRPAVAPRPDVGSPRTSTAVARRRDRRGRRRERRDARRRRRRSDAEPPLDAAVDPSPSPTFAVASTGVIDIIPFAGDPATDADEDGLALDEDPDVEALGAIDAELRGRRRCGRPAADRGGRRRCRLGRPAVGDVRQDRRRPRGRRVLRLLHRAESAAARKPRDGPRMRHPTRPIETVSNARRRRGG